MYVCIIERSVYTGDFFFNTKKKLPCTLAYTYHLYTWMRKQDQVLLQMSLFHLCTILWVTVWTFLSLQFEMSLNSESSKKKKKERNEEKKTHLFAFFSSQEKYSSSFLGSDQYWMIQTLLWKKKKILPSHGWVNNRHFRSRK